MSRKQNSRGGNNSKSNKAMKYMVRADIKVNGTVQRKDIIGAIMGQTEGLLGDELELRKLQRTARIGHVDVEMESKGGKVHGMILIPSSLDNVETAAKREAATHFATPTRNMVYPKSPPARRCNFCTCRARAYCIP